MHHPLAGDKLGALVKTLGLIIVLCVSAIANPAKGMAASLLSNRPDDLALLQQMLKQQTVCRLQEGGHFIQELVWFHAYSISRDLVYTNKQDIHSALVGPR
jgi:hypothetical protein